MKTVLILNKGKYSAVQDKNRVTAPYNEQNSCAAAKEHGNRAALRMYGRLNTLKYTEGK